MAYKSIQFKSDDVTAVIDNVKCEFRIPLKYQSVLGADFSEAKGMIAFPCNDDEALQHSPYCIGEVVYVKETWAKYGSEYLYRAGPVSGEDSHGMAYQLKWKPATQMPRNAARLFLEITDIKLQHIQDITIDEITHEGIWIHGSLFPKDTCAERWDGSMSEKKRSKYGWNMNPWVWAFTFRRCEKPEDWDAEID